MNNNLLESLLDGFENLDGPLTANSIYVSTMLENIAGQEGFTDSIKKGATKSIAWIKQILTTIMDAILSWFGGRDKVKAKIDKIKRSKLFEVFEPKITVKVRKIAVPATMIALRHITSIIDDEYQEFHQDKLKETPEIRSFFVGVNKMEELLQARLKEAAHSPKVEHLDFSTILTKAKESIEAGRKFISKAEKEETDKEIVKNIGNSIAKLGRAVNVLSNASVNIDKGIDELVKEAEKE